MTPILTDGDVAAICTAAVLLAAHAHRLAPREARLVVLGSERFLAHGRAARIRARTRARIARAAERLRAVELSRGGLS